VPARRPVPAEGGAISYEQWGVDFFLEAVSEQRILGAVNTIAGQPIDFGPMGVGPGRIAKVRAYGEIGAANATKRHSDHISYRVELPVSLTFEVDLQVETHRFLADLLVPVTLTALARPGVRIFIEATPPRSDEVQVDLEAQGLRASVLQRVVGVEDELRRFVAGYVRRELDKPHVRQARMIDVSRAIDRAWSAIAPGPREDGVTADLNAALEREIRDNEDTFVAEPEGR
jgi:hypothetical protein